MTDSSQESTRYNTNADSETTSERENAARHVAPSPEVDAAALAQTASATASTPAAPENAEAPQTADASENTPAPQAAENAEASSETPVHFDLKPRRLPLAATPVIPVAPAPEKAAPIREEIAEAEAEEAEEAKEAKEAEPAAGEAEVTEHISEEVGETEPSAVEAEPSVVEAEPSVVEAEPSVVETKPSSAEAETDIEAETETAVETEAETTAEAETAVETETTSRANDQAHQHTPGQARKVRRSEFLKAFKQSVISEFKPIKADDPSPLKRRQQEYLLYRRQRGAAGSVLLIHALLTILLMIVWAVLPRNFLGIDKLALDGGMFSTLLTQGFTVLLPSVFVLYLYNMDISLVAGRTSQPVSVFGLAALIGIPAAIAFSGLNNITLYLLSQLGFHPTSDSLLGLVSNPSPLTYILLILVTALIPAICEEIMFRGVIQTSLALSGRTWLSIILMATAFMLYHGDPYFLVAPFFAGIYLGFIRHKTDNLFVTMLMHFFMNTTLVILQPILPLFTSSMSFAGSAGRTALYASIIAAAVALVTLIPLTSALTTNSAKATSPDPIRKRLQQEQWFPADWKFLLALLIMFVTMLVLGA